MLTQACNERTEARFQQIAVEPSRSLLIFILSTHLAAALVVWLSQLGAYLCLALDGVVLASAIHSVRQHWLVGRRVLFWRDGGWSLIANAGAEEAAVSFHSPVLLWPWLIILRLRPPSGGVISLLILPDNSDAETRRRLRVLLRTQGLASAS